jgi:hypothetical protein
LEENNREEKRKSAVKVKLRTDLENLPGTPCEISSDTILSVDILAAYEDKKGNLQFDQASFVEGEDSYIKAARRRLLQERRSESPSNETNEQSRHCENNTPIESVLPTNVTPQPDNQPQVSTVNDGDIPLTEQEQEVLSKISERRRNQIKKILQAIKDKRFQAKAIPDNGKSILSDYCREKWTDLFGIGPDPFKCAWKVARQHELVRMAHHEKYTKGRV